jgi:DNA-binding NarL/FixJ family response regulator
MTDRAVRVAVVEDQPLYRQMLVGLLHAAPGITVAGSAATAADARRLDATAFDVALVDLDLGDGDGFDVGAAFRDAHPRIGIVILSAVDALHRMVQLDRQHAEGWSYLSKTSALSAGSLVATLRASKAGRTVIDPSLAATREPRSGTPLEALTDRQREVLSLLASGMTNMAIADQLGIASRSADNHVNAIYGALGLAASDQRNPRVQAALLFVEHSR